MFERFDIKKENLKESFVEIEGCKIITDVDRAAVALTFEGIKPVSEIDMWKEFAVSEQEFEDSKKRLLADLSLIGIFYKKEDPEYDSCESYLIAKRKEDLDKVSQLSTEDLKKYYFEIGKLFGYPQTAIEAFVAEDTLSFDEIEKMSSEDRLILRHFINLALSKKHWREELDIFKKEFVSIERYMPNFYERVTTSPELELTQEVFDDIFKKKEFKKHEELLKRTEKYLIRFKIKEIRDPQTGDPIPTDFISKIVQENL